MTTPSRPASSETRPNAHPTCPLQVVAGSAGVRVVDLTMNLSGPFATMILAQQGADVIKVERPPGGDILRHVGSGRGGTSAYFVNTNWGKRSIALDFDQDARPRTCAAGGDRRRPGRDFRPRRCPGSASRPSRSSPSTPPGLRSAPRFPVYS